MIVLGFCLDIDNIFLVLMILRWTITKLRCLGLGSYMPLDNNIYLHKVVACFVFLHASIHTLAHLLNFGKLLICLTKELLFWIRLYFKYHKNPNISSSLIEFYSYQCATRSCSFRIHQWHYPTIQSSSKMLDQRKWNCTRMYKFWR